MCHNQVLQRGDYASFSVLGICIILILGGFFISLNVCITPITRKLWNRTQLHKFRNDSWVANELLELHSMALESLLDKAASSISTAEVTTPKHTADSKETSQEDNIHDAA